MKITLNICLLLYCVFLFPALGQENAQVFSEANTLFQQANKEALQNPDKAQELYESSALKYQFLIQQRDLKTAELYTNLGNAFYRSNDKGRAMLAYNRALEADPTCHDASHNRRFVRSNIIDEISPNLGQKIASNIFFWHRWHYLTRLIIFALSHLIFWGLLTWLLFQSKKKTKIYTLVALFLSVLFFFSLLSTHLRWDQKVDGVITAREAQAKQGNGYIYTDAFLSPLHAGTEFTLIEKRGNWIHARLLNGVTCWLSVKSVEMVR